MGNVEVAYTGRSSKVADAVQFFLKIMIIFFLISIF